MHYELCIMHYEQPYRFLYLLNQFPPVRHNPNGATLELFIFNF